MIVRNAVRGVLLLVLLFETSGMGRNAPESLTLLILGLAMVLIARFFRRSTSLTVAEANIEAGSRYAAVQAKDFVDPLNARLDSAKAV